MNDQTTPRTHAFCEGVSVEEAEGVDGVQRLNLGVANANSKSHIVTPRQRGDQWQTEMNKADQTNNNGTVVGIKTEKIGDIDDLSIDSVRKASDQVSSIPPIHQVSPIHEKSSDDKSSIQPIQSQPHEKQPMHKTQPLENQSMHRNQPLHEKSPNSLTKPPIKEMSSPSSNTPISTLSIQTSISSIEQGSTREQAQDVQGTTQPSKPSKSTEHTGPDSNEPDSNEIDSNEIDSLRSPGSPGSNEPAASTIPSASGPVVQKSMSFDGYASHDFGDLQDLLAPSNPITSRKAARSLRLFMPTSTEDDDVVGAPRRNSRMLTPNEETGDEDGPGDVVEPISSATYFPHTPADPNAPFTAPLPLPPTVTHHLTADVEFDHLLTGNITRITKEEPQQAEETHEPAAVNSASQVFPLAVELRPFKNKVGGHTAIFSFSKRAVCKALMNRENLFYETVELKHPELLRFMPRYIGVLNVRYLSMVDEIAEPTPAQSTAIADADDSREPPEVVLDDNKHMIPDALWKQYSGSYPLPLTEAENGESSENSAASLMMSPHHTADHRNTGLTLINTDLQAQILQEVFRPRGEPRSDEISTRDHSRDHGDIFSMDVEEPVVLQRKHTRFERFILLEDLTVNMARPCVLDLKMGTRQYGIEATAAKQKSQRRKCRATTLRQLGVRVCGLQIFHAGPGGELVHVVKDKYFGRRVKIGVEFGKVLAKYLYDGVSDYLVLVKIPRLVGQLHELYDIFRELRGYRMYGLSILLMYDGGSERAEEQVMVKIIDFAQSAILTEDQGDISSAAIPPAHPEQADGGYLRGLLSLIGYFEVIFRVLAGEDFVSPEESYRMVTANKERYMRANKWLDAYAEVDDGNDGKCVDSDDIFDVEYPEQDEDVVSE